MATIKHKLTDAHIRSLTFPKDRAVNSPYFERDTEVTGLKVRVTSTGHKAWVLTYKTKTGIDRTLTIGDFEDWPTQTARARARELRREVDKGEDPLAGYGNDSPPTPVDADIKTVDDLCNAYVASRFPTIEEGTQRLINALLRNHIRPSFGKLRIHDAGLPDAVSKMYLGILANGHIPAANNALKRTAAIFNWATTSRRDLKIAFNPAKGIKRARERERNTPLSDEQVKRLPEALDAHPQRIVCYLIEFLLLVGTRHGKARTAKWDEFQLEGGSPRWTPPPGSSTKAAKPVPLGDAAVALLHEVKAVGRRQRLRLSAPRGWRGAPTPKVA